MRITYRGVPQIFAPLLVPLCLFPVLLLQGCGGSPAAVGTLPQLTNLTIVPRNPQVALGQTVQVLAQSTLPDGTVEDVSKTVVWFSGDPGIASIDSSGLVTSRSEGVVWLSAKTAALTVSTQLTVSKPSLKSIEVSPATLTIPLGTPAQLKATGHYSDGSTQDVTKSITWTSSDPSIAVVNGNGMVASASAGQASLSATSGSLKASCQLTVLPAALVTISVDSDRSAIPEGLTVQLTARGTYTDGTMQDLTHSVSWTSSPARVIAMNQSGLATAKSIGTATVAARLGSISGTSTLVVSAVQLSTITVSMAETTLPLGTSEQLTAQGAYSDGSTQDVTAKATWKTDDATIVQVSTNGSASALQVGSTTVRADLNGVEGTAAINVQPVSWTTYFSPAILGGDQTVRISALGGTTDNLCAMVYVFDQDQQMAECCGCYFSENGLRTLSLNKDLTANPLTGVRPVTGSLTLVTADYQSNPSCNPASTTPSGNAAAWATHLQPSGQNSYAVSETPLTRTPLSATLSSALQAQCYFIQQLGGGQGICQCGTGD